MTLPLQYWLVLSTDPPLSFCWLLGRFTLKFAFGASKWIDGFFYHRFYRLDIVFPQTENANLEPAVYLQKAEFLRVEGNGSISTLAETSLHYGKNMGRGFVNQRCSIFAYQCLVVHRRVASAVTNLWSPTPKSGVPSSGGA
ncbi:hypothetical protein B0H16DRAFT_1687584 [Mycena metata]|uniref:Uncharacterized protein n=1 Tax=Mycena metata TaxID=1033252 RepID=A0AAD7NL16_9AGAR|nr:hypothetical protein B0H16DRAFT_1687584 [Mycena metata]